MVTTTLSLSVNFAGWSRAIRTEYSRSGSAWGREMRCVSPGDRTPCQGWPSVSVASPSARSQRLARTAARMTATAARATRRRRVECSDGGRQHGMATSPWWAGDTVGWVRLCEAGPHTGYDDGRRRGRQGDDAVQNKTARAFGRPAVPAVVVPAATTEHGGRRLF